MKNKTCHIGIILFIIILFSNCTKQHGYIKDIETNLPIQGVLLTDCIDKQNYTTTDENGMFSFINCNDLSISKKFYKSDTLKKHGCKPSGKCFNGHVFYMTPNKSEVR
ncbi:hypothetical protein [Flavobacterium hungaricum]|uniref:Carboxypeptidase regulatory-like domain-containing protein n=1 Tax=Flavobacterium hungaricum TaxID=2082725 RepID=A0ABR9TPT8_9FLAO|nr:hypothetical protein [Flavobacterium hungaricum]MBE8726789.1 hypothetical protein [Flavobacterium hungaricum]